MRLGVLFVFLGLDFGVKQLANHFKGIRKEGEPTLRTRDEVFNHGILPNRSADEEFGPLKAPYHSNSLGLRDSHVRDVPPCGPNFRVLFLGNSFTEGGGFPWEDIFVGRVQKALQGEGVEVLNGAVASYSPLLCRLKVEDLILKKKIRIDMVVMCLDVGTVRDVYFFEETPEGTSRFLPYGPFQAQAARLARADFVCQWLEKNVEKNFVVLGAVTRNLRLLYLAQTRDDGLGLMDTIPDWAYNWPEYQGPQEKLIREGLARSERQMEDLASFLQQQKVRLAVVVYPWPQQIRAGKADSRMVTFWSNWCHRHGAFFLSVFPDFLSQGLPDEILRAYYIEGDRHWNVGGHRLVAGALLDPRRGLPLWIGESRRNP